MKRLTCGILLTAWSAVFIAMTLAACAPKVEPTAPAQQAAPKPGVVGTKDIYEQAFIYGFPIVVGYSVLYQYNVDKSSPQYKAPFNHIWNSAQVYTYKDTAVQTPNSDTPYSIVQADLRVEPLVLCMPAISKNRYYDVQLTDMYTFNYGYMGSRTTGNGPGCYMVAGPTWNGQAPPGIAKVFRSETTFSVAIFRTQVFGADDVDNVKKIQAGYKVEVLSAFLHKPAPPPAPAINWPKYSKDMFIKDFPGAMNFLLQFLPPTGPAASEKPLRDKFASVGIAPGKPYNFKNLSASDKAALLLGIKEAFDKITKAADNIGAPVNGWRIGAAAGSRAFYNGDWLLRAVGAKVGIYGNDAQEASYPYTKSDKDGDPLDGSKHNYTLTFPPGQLPPVRAFWSITMYDAKTQLLIKNPINRYLINSPMLPTLKKDADGSITLYIQKNSPGKDEESNWLPAPNGTMFIVMRLYWPSVTPPSVLPLGKGTWSPPPIVKTS